MNPKKLATLSNKFTKLTSLQRQLWALQALCYEWPSWKARQLFDAVTSAGLQDENNKRLAKTKYDNSLRELRRLGFLSKSGEDWSEVLRHRLLVLVPASELQPMIKIAMALYTQRVGGGYYTYYGDLEEILGQVHVAIYANDPAVLISETLGQQKNNIDRVFFYLQVLFFEAEIDLPWLETRDPIIQLSIVIGKLSSLISETTQTVDFFAILDFYRRQDYSTVGRDDLLYFSALIDIALGDCEKAFLKLDQFQDEKSGYALSLQGTRCFFQGELSSALPLYKKAVTALKKIRNTSSYYFADITGIFHTLCLLYAESPGDKASRHEQWRKYMGHYQKYFDKTPIFPMQISYDLLALLVIVAQGNVAKAQAMIKRVDSNADIRDCPLIATCYALVQYVLDTCTVQENSATISGYVDWAEKHQHQLFCHILRELLACNDATKIKATKWLSNSPIPLRFLDVIDAKPSWEYAFEALEGLIAGDAQQQASTMPKKRLLWLLDPKSQWIEVVEQSMGKTGRWTKGRPVSLKRLYCEPEHFDYLLPEDKQALRGLERSYDWGLDYEFDTYKTILGLVGHPNIAHRDNRSVPMELVKTEPELLVEETKDGYRFSLSHSADKVGLLLEPETMQRYKVIDFSQEYWHIHQILSSQGLTVPRHAKEKVMQVIQQAKGDISIHADVSDIALPEMPADVTPCVQLLPVPPGIKVSLWVKPTGEGYCRIAQGKKSLMVMKEEAGQATRYRVNRDFDQEAQALSALHTVCPTLSTYQTDANEYNVDEPEAVLELLSSLQTFREQHPLHLEWPEGESFKIKNKLSSENVSLRIESSTNWFEYEGEVRLAEDQVIGLQTLLSQFDQQVGRFIQLDDGQFIELSSQLYRQLNVLRHTADEGKVYHLGAQALSDLVESVEEVTFDQGWENHLKQIRQMEKHTPKIPSTLQAELRDYQIEGFHYLSRLTHWGIGACLADDMGLGKTIQAITLLLERAKKGPSLVIAPTSVCFNWLEECRQFAPSLQMHTMQVTDRDALIKDLSAFDVLVCSYGLLHYHAETLASREWECLILDEAQAIKNPNTKRWRSVMQLKSKSRIALTGTPIENHLGELWSIFSFINPGLLGNAKRFQSQYALPIESYQSSDKLLALKSLVKPYILRRIKSEVLTELPPKVEQTIYIEPSQEELTFYEALRRNALERMSQVSTENKRMSMLAEITKLKQACCDSSLVDADIVIPNSKIKQFKALLKNIVENKHKVLVFSQYVRFLKKIRTLLDEEGITYHYLDGSTPVAKRKKVVQSFQAGESDVFLLSLKAGGSGLNLTAADYVIHLDPWWNPAVEDQASDRAHRIGQERTVTVYRLVMKGTIEEKIMQMHQEKRHLASELLSGQGMRGKLTEEDLMALMVV